jgi:hypothetical protein
MVLCNLHKETRLFAIASGANKRISLLIIYKNEYLSILFLQITIMAVSHRYQL